MEFKVGDVVQIKSDLVPGQNYDGVKFYPGKMADTAGKIDIVDRIVNGCYRLRSYTFLYSGEMLSLIERPSYVPDITELFKG